MPVVVVVVVPTAEQHWIAKLNIRLLPDSVQLAFLPPEQVPAINGRHDGH